MPAPGRTDCPEYTFVKIADTNTPVPGGNGGTFEVLKLSDPAVYGLRVVFSGEGGGVKGVFAGDGTMFGSMISEGDPAPGGGTIDTIYTDYENFAFSGGVLNVIAKPSNGDRGIYSVDATGLSKIVEFGEPAPSGGTFQNIFFVGRQDANLAFQANVFQNGRPELFAGVFTRIAGVNDVVADSTTEIPASEPTTFSSFSDPDISGNNVAFYGGYGPLTGVYARIDGTLKKVADINDTPPGNVKKFTGLYVPSISGRKVVFLGLADHSAIYAGDGGPLTVIVETGDPAPGYTTFTGFDPNVSADGDDVAFSAGGSGFIGLFVSSGQYGLCRVIDTNQTLEAKDITQLFMGRDSYAVGKLGFRVAFSDGSRAIYLAKAKLAAKLPVGALFILLDESDD